MHLNVPSVPDGQDSDDRTPVGTGIASGRCDVPAGHIVAAGPTTSPDAATLCALNTVRVTVGSDNHSVSALRLNPDTGQTECDSSTSRALTLTMGFKPL